MADASCSPELLGSVISGTSDHGNSIERERETSQAHLGLQPGPETGWRRWLTCTVAGRDSCTFGEI
jgi:hypothetical protein